MKNRTIQEIHDKEIGHRKFARVCDVLIANGHEVSDIKEYNETFKFKLDGFPFEYRKEWKASAKDMAHYLMDLLDYKKQIAEFQKRL